MSTPRKKKSAPEPDRVRVYFYMSTDQRAAVYDLAREATRPGERPSTSAWFRGLIDRERGAAKGGV